MELSQDSVLPASSRRGDTWEMGSWEAGPSLLPVGPNSECAGMRAREAGSAELSRRLGLEVDKDGLQH